MAYGGAPVARALVDRGAQIDAKDHHGWTPAMMAASRGSLAHLIFLADQGVRFDEKTPHGDCALSLAREVHGARGKACGDFIEACLERWALGQEAQAPKSNLPRSLAL
jgi:hypothetical protein